jgi:hypothetical protein
VIQVAARIQRSFACPADLTATSAFFRDFGRVLDYLPHLRLVTTYGPDQHRVLFTATEAGLYRLAFFCDIQIEYDPEALTLRIAPLVGPPPVPPQAHLGSLTGQGYYASAAVFRPGGASTGVDYAVEIRATIAKRLEWRLIPDSTVERIANARTRQRLSEITDEFTMRVVAQLRR